MKNDFIQAINQVCAERNLSQEIVIEAVEAALVSAYKRNFGASDNIRTKLDPATGQVHVYAEKEIVEVVEDPKLHVTLEVAVEIRPEAAIGETVLVETTPRNFGRIAAQTAKQVILQRIREAERDVLYNTYIDRQGELITGTVQSIDYQGLTLNLGKAEAALPRHEQIPGERPHQNQRIKAYVVAVNKTNRGPQIVVSRTHRNMLRRLLETEVPEIFNGTVEIKHIAREAGSRSKVAVVAVQEGVDPVGSCVGMRGVRIQSIVSELNGEKIDIVEWSLDLATFIANALSPAKVMNVILREEPDGSKTASVIVPDRQLSLAIGKEGQNARLAAKLTGWRIDIKNASEAAEEALALASAPEVTAAELAVSGEDILAKAEAILMSQPGEDEDQLEGALPLTEEETAALAEGASGAVVITGETAVDEAVPEPVEPEAVEEAEAEAVAAVEGAEGPEAYTVAEVVEDDSDAEIPVGEVEIEEALKESEPEEVAGVLESEPEGEGMSAAEEEQLPEAAEPFKEGEDEDMVLFKKKKARKRTLVFDEDSGELVSKRLRKPGRVQDWEDHVDDAE
jgi:N utilization substance protein A